jgi:hypothetical protein
VNSTDEKDIGTADTTVICGYTHDGSTTFQIEASEKNYKCSLKFTNSLRPLESVDCV